MIFTFIKLVFGGTLIFKRQLTAQNVKCISLDKILMNYTTTYLCLL